VSALQDIRFAVRSLVRSRGLAVAAGLTLAVGIGANTAVFSIVDAILLRPLPYDEPDGLATAGYLQIGEYLVLRENARFAEELGIYSPGVGFNVQAGEEPLRLTGALMSPETFSVLRARPHVGRAIAPGEDRPGADPVVVLSHSLWLDVFGGSEKIIGRDILIDSRTHRVVGVMPRGFNFPNSDTRLWVPLTINPADPVALWGGGGGESVLRLRDGFTVDRAEMEVRTLAPILREANVLWTPPPEYGLTREVIPLQERIVGAVRTRFLLILGAVAVVLLIACVNVANLLLVRAVARRREMAVRTALGARPARLMLLVLAENAVLAISGGLLGLLIAFWSIDVVRSVLPPDTPRLGEIAVEGRVLLFAAAVTLLTALLVGIYPAFRASRTDPSQALKEGSRGAGGDGGRAGGQRRITSALVVTELALAVVLLVGAGLLIRSFWTLSGVDPGFQSSSLLSARITPPEIRYGEAVAQRAFYEELLARADAVPGVQGTAFVDRLPLTGSDGGMAIETEEEPYVQGSAAAMVVSRRASPDYLRLMGVPLLSGRMLETTDVQGSADVALVSEAMARAHWPGADAVGKRFKPVWWRDRWITVVGVVGNIRQEGLAADVEPAIYRPFMQDPTADMTLVARTSLSAGAVAPTLRAAVSSIDPQVPMSEVLTVGEVVSRSVAEPRLTMYLLALFAATALFLAAVGIYGLIAYATRQRTHEIGVRMALGAEAPRIVLLVVRQAVVLATLGILLGLGGALVGTRTLQALLYGVSTTDPTTFIAVPILLLVVAVAAAYVPARRAASVSPMAALRAE
jgi:putative ABC transport system permease protein